MHRPRGGRFHPAPVTAVVISRRRLFDRLAARSTVVVLGPAGYGKSLLLSSWLAEAPPSGVVAWLTLDPSDQDPRAAGGRAPHGTAHTQVRATLAAATLMDLGFTDVVNLAGGMNAWKQAGLPTAEAHSKF